MNSKKVVSDIKLDISRINNLYEKVSGHIEQAHSSVKRTIDSEVIKTYWLIGKEIVEEEQHGEKKAAYGKAVLKQLSLELQKKYKKGFGVDSLEQARKFYLVYQRDIEALKSDSVCRNSVIPNFNPKLSWSHYRSLMRIPDYNKRCFYEIETSNNSWSIRELQRQINSRLYERIAKNKDHTELQSLSKNGHEIAVPEDTLKDPLVLEFLGIPESHKLVESKLEDALISNLQHFLLELGKGFAFVARQKRLTLEGDHFYADLVFYHTILKCYVIVELKTKPLAHEDLGQILLYVNYFDQEIKMGNDNPTIGLVLCTAKNDKMVRYTLGEQAKQVFAREYQFHLPTEQELEIELKKEIDSIKERLDIESD